MRAALQATGDAAGSSEPHEEYFTAMQDQEAARAADPHPGTFTTCGLPVYSTDTAV